ncbi:hypothetical protein Q7P37_010936 [Cladosporium fusiforme]
MLRGHHLDPLPMTRLPHLVLLLSVVATVLASPGILSKKSLITRDGLRPRPTGSPTIGQEEPQPADSPSLIITSAPAPVLRRNQASSDASDHSSSVTPADYHALNVLQSALSTYSSNTTASTSLSTSSDSSLADFTTRSSESSFPSQQYSAKSTTPISGTTRSATSLNAWTTSTISVTLTSASLRSTPKPASPLPPSDFATLTTSNASYAMPSTVSVSSPSASSFSTITTVVAVAGPTSSAVAQNAVDFGAATTVIVEKTQSQTTTSVQCAYDHFKHVDDGHSKATASESMPVGVKETLDWLTQSTGSFNPGQTSINYAIAEATHIRTAGANRLRFKLW